MKRPLCFLSLVITAIVYLYLEFFLSDHLFDHSKEDGNKTQIVGMVDRKEYRVDYLGELSPVLYIIPQERKISLCNKYIQCYMSKEDYKEPKVGEYVMVSGIIKSFSSGRNPGEFDSRLYYSTLKIEYRIKDARIIKRAGNENKVYETLYQIKYSLEKVLDENLDSKDSSVMKAILLGDKAFMDENTKRLYKDAGIIHILAVSGLHISILGMGLYRLLKRLRLPMIPRALMPVILMYFYGQMCGMSSSAARAIVMFALSLLAKVIGRTYDLLSALSLVELLLLIEQPLYLYNSGFLFSFGAIVGIGYIMPAVIKLLPKEKCSRLKFADDKKEGFFKKIQNYVKSSLIAGLSIFLATVPVYMSFYFVYPIQSVFLNLFILPLMAPLMILGIILMVLGLVLNTRIVIVGAMIHLILKWYEALSVLSARLPVGKLYLGHASKLQILIYVFGLLVFVTMIERTRNRENYKWGVLILGVSLTFLLLDPRPELQISMLDVGQGDGIVIRTRRENYLIDGGSTDKKDIGKYTIIPYLYYEGIGTLDAVFITHEDEDHISGVFEIMDDMENGGIRIKNLVMPDISEASKGENYKRLINRAKDLNIPVSYISCKDRINSAVEIRCLNPVSKMTVEGANAYSSVLYLKYKDFSALFTGDVEGEGERHLLDDIKGNQEMLQKITLLKVAHHGSKNSTSKEMLDYLNPRIALISCGIDNRYGHPHKELLERFDGGSTRIYRTDRSGAITVTVSGQKVMIREFL